VQHNYCIMLDELVELIRTAVVRLPTDVRAALEHALEAEAEELPKLQLRMMLENAACAEEHRIPLCQDTGVPVFFLRGEWEPGMEHLLAEAVRRATEEVPLRPCIVHPLSRSNTGDNTGVHVPVVHRLGHEEPRSITFMPKGAGSENCSAAALLSPSAGAEEIAEFVAEVVRRAGAKPCPPVVLGVGVGGTLEHAALLSKLALLQPLGSANSEPELAELEERILSRVNALGTGAMGFGGRSTCLGVHLLAAHCHTASLPVAVSVQCWAHRRATLVERAGRLEVVQP